MKENDLNLDVLSWKDIKKPMKAVNPELAAIIDETNPNDTCKFYLAKYRYGDKLCNQGEFYLPNKDGNLTHISDVTSSIANDLMYNGNTHAALIVMSKTIETYIDLYDRCVPNIFYTAGDIAGISLIMLPQSERPLLHTGHAIYNIAAGCRSTLMVPKISQDSKHKKLRRYFNADIPKPKHYLDHFDTFTEIARHDTSWCCEILYFGRGLFEKMHRENKYRLNLYLYQKIYQSHSFWSNQFPWDLTLSRIETKRDIKGKNAIINFAKYIFALCTGKIVGQSPAVDDSTLPYKFIANAYEDIYRLDSTPIIMHPNYLNKSPLYCSIQFPLIDGSANLDKLTSGITYLDDIRYYFESYRKALSSENELQLKWSPLTECIKDKDISFFHSYNNEYQSIQNTASLEEDTRFKSSKYRFNGNHPYFNGCVKIESMG